MNAKRRVFFSILLTTVILLLTMLGCDQAAQPSPATAVPSAVVERTPSLIEQPPVSNSGPNAIPEPIPPYLGSLEFAETPALGREVGLTFAVTPLVDAPIAKVEFLLPEEAFEIISGASVRDASLAANEQAEFTLVVKTIKVGDWTVSAKFIRLLRAGQTEGKTAILYVSVTESGATVSSTKPGKPITDNRVPVEKLEEPKPDVNEPVNGLLPYQEDPLEDRATPQGKSSLRTVFPLQCAGGTITIFGKWLYRDQAGADHAVRDGRTEIWDETPSGNRLLATTYTASDGSYTVEICNDDESGGVDIFVRISSTNDASVNVTNIASATYIGDTETVFNLPDGPHNVGTAVAIGLPGGNPFFIYDKLANDARYYLIQEAGWQAALPVLQVRWGPDGGISTSQYFPGQSRIDLRDTAVWEPDVILHEYGHFVMDRVYPTYPDTPNCSGHSAGVKTSQGCAWSEGWATYLQSAIQDDRFYDDPPFNIHWDLEIGDPTWQDDDDEGAVFMSLWDMYDNAVDGTDAYGNLDFNTIFVVFTAGAPDNTFSQYWGSWKSWFPGPNPHQCAVTSIYQGHITNYEADGWVNCAAATPVLAGGWTESKIGGLGVGAQQLQTTSGRSHFF